MKKVLLVGPLPHPQSRESTSQENPEHERLEASLKMRELSFRTLGENIPENIARWDREGRFLYINPVLERTLGVAETEAIGKRMSEAFPDGRFTPAETSLAQVVATGKMMEHIMQPVPLENGMISIHHVSLIPELDAEREVVSVLGIGRDMTESYENNTTDIHRLRETITEREWEFFSLAENSPNLIYRYDRNCCHLYVNRAGCRLSGKAMDDLIERTPADDSIFISGQNEKLMEAIRRVFASNEGMELELDFIGRTGQLFSYQMRLVPECNGSDRVFTVLGIANDITAIRDSERLMSQFLSNVPGFLFSFRRTPDGQFSFPFVTLGIEAIYGLRPEDVKEDMAPLHAMAHPDDAPRIEAAIAESAEKMTPAWFEFRVRRPGIPDRWMEIRSMPVPDLDGGIIWHGLMQDINARKQAEEELARKEREFRTLAENIPEPVIRFDIDGRHLYVNQALVQLSGESAESLLGNTPRDARSLSRANAEVLMRSIRQVVETGSEVENELEFMSEDGVRIVFHNRFAPEFGRDGKVTSVISISRDITALKEGIQEASPVISVPD